MTDQAGPQQQTGKIKKDIMIVQGDPQQRY